MRRLSRSHTLDQPATLGSATNPALPLDAQPPRSQSEAPVAVCVSGVGRWLRTKLDSTIFCVTGRHRSCNVSVCHCDCHFTADCVSGRSCGTTALTTLPDALLDDDAISPMAKMAYWYLKRHRGDVLVSDIAQALRMDRQNPWVLLIELSDAGWITYPTIAQQVGGEDGGKARNGPRFTVHEVPVKREPRTATRAQIAESQRILDSAESRGAKR